MAIASSFSLRRASSLSPTPLHGPRIISSPSRLLFFNWNLRSRPPAFCSMTTAASSPPAAATVGEDLPVDYADWLPAADPAERRRAGVLLHPTSLPGPYGIGDLGEEAFRFLDWLHDSGCSVWQVLPLVPPGRKAGEDGSPYAGQDANCGNTLLISLEELVNDGLLNKDELPEPIMETRVNLSVVAEAKDPLIAKAAKRLVQSNGDLKRQLQDFRGDPSISRYV